MLISYIRIRPLEAFSLKQLFQGLNLTTHPLKMLCTDIVQEMVEDNFLIEVEKGKYKLNDKGQILTGTFQRKATERTRSFRKTEENRSSLPNGIRPMP